MQYSPVARSLRPHRRAGKRCATGVSQKLRRLVCRQRCWCLLRSAGFEQGIQVGFAGLHGLDFFLAGAGTDQAVDEDRFARGLSCPRPSGSPTRWPEDEMPVWVTGTAAWQRSRHWRESVYACMFRQGRGGDVHLPLRQVDSGPCGSARCPPRFAPVRSGAHALMPFRGRRSNHGQAVIRIEKKRNMRYLAVTCRFAAMRHRGHEGHDQPGGWHAGRHSPCQHHGGLRCVARTGQLFYRAAAIALHERTGNDKQCARIPFSRASSACAGKQVW